MKFTLPPWVCKRSDLSDLLCFEPIKSNCGLGYQCTGWRDKYKMRTKNEWYKLTQMKKIHPQVLEPDNENAFSRPVWEKRRKKIFVIIFLFFVKKLKFSFGKIFREKFSAGATTFVQWRIILYNSDPGFKWIRYISNSYKFSPHFILNTRIYKNNSQKFKKDF